jgi:hypothetical protein
MQNDKLKVTSSSNCLYLGFTAVLGALITITADAIVWYRMLLAGFLFFIILKKKLSIPLKSFDINIRWILIAMHWVTFFHAIHVSNVSITLSVFH